MSPLDDPLLMTLYVAAMVFLGLDALFAWMFVARYARVRWYESAEGRHLMRFTMLLALMFTFTLFGQLVKPRPLTSLVLSCVLFGWAAFELGIRVWLERRAQREARREG